MDKSKEKKITIEADFIRKTKDQWCLQYKGEPIWFPKKHVTFNQEKKELECPRWLLKEKFPNENF